MSQANQKLKALMDKHSLSIKDISKLKRASEDTVKAYLTDPKSKRFRRISDSAVAELEIQIEHKKKLVAGIHNQFEVVLSSLEQLVEKEYGYSRKDLFKIHSNSNKFRMAKAFFSVADKINGIWIDYIALDLDDLSLLEMEENLKREMEDSIKEYS